MKIMLAKTAGFCMGVKRAVDIAFEHVSKAKGPVYTFGPLIHNPQVQELLEARGVELLTEIPDKGTGTVIIRAHGIAPQQRAALTNAGFNLIDATCPKVVKVQKIIAKYYAEGSAIIILGEKEHPEVMGLNGFAENRAHIVQDMAELTALPIFDKAVVVAQTTLNRTLFETAQAWLKSRHPHYKIINTICNSTEHRQQELRDLRDKVDGFVIVGGRDSGNTRRLAEIASETGRPTLHVENVGELTPANCAPFINADRVLLSAGASTPNWAIQAVNHTLKIMSLKRLSGRWLLARLTAFLYLGHSALALACLTYMCQHFYDGGFGLLLPATAFCYGWAMHVTSKIGGTKAAGFHAPLLSSVYARYKFALSVSCLIAGILALMLGFYTSLPLGVAIAVLFGLRFLYDFWPLARRFSGQYSYFIDMPYTKALGVSVAWGAIAGALPGWGLPGALVFSVSIWAMLLAFARVMCQDLFATQTDRICGQTTFTLLLGVKTALVFTGVLLLALALLPPTLYYAGGIRSEALPAMLCPALMLVIVAFYACNRQKVTMPFKMEMLVSLSFIIPALILLLGDVAALI